eukprot:CAMPEP_0204834274 /NCGR_PEP_ID=MMETSP1346-20131115/19372_1 /ASSEMBLY_ACC=CAM_ASM_000771 /TAXON_ID=215587 /ORGANISM="Aplanochytrium stocchinoi, Strain GSBS06" /LENGTH=217 /DNA_ID=CAMNT_0051967487 /DNA_START=107 /DNA_END=757 /DNA_ORIENTATION=+
MSARNRNKEKVVKENEKTEIEKAFSEVTSDHGRSILIWALTAFVCTLVIGVTDFLSATSLALTAGMLSNSVVRIASPSSYVPARQIREGFIYGPVFARILATMAEFTFYYTEGVASGGLSVILPLTIFGESMCWLHLLLQSELLGFIEDCTWATVHGYAIYCSFAFNRPLAIGLGVPYMSYTLLKHLPDTFRRVLHTPLTHPFSISVGPLDPHSVTW